MNDSRGNRTVHGCASTGPGGSASARGEGTDGPGRRGATAPGGGAPGAACAGAREQPPACRCGGSRPGSPWRALVRRTHRQRRGSPRPARSLTSPWTRRSGAPASGRRPGRDGGVCGRRGLRAAGPGGGWRGRAYLAERRSHLVGEGPGHDHDVGLARAGPEDHAEAVHVVAGRRHVHHLHGAAGQAEGHGPQGALGAGQSVVSEQWPAFKDRALSRRTSRS